MGPTATTDDIRSLLLWARAHGFRVSELEMAGVKVRVDDLRVESAGTVEQPPRTAHHAFAKLAGIDQAMLDDPEDDDEARA